MAVKKKRVKTAAKAKGPGRPSLAGGHAPGERSPIIGLRLPPAELSKVDSLAERENVKRSEMVRRLLLAGIAAYKPRKG